MTDAVVAAASVAEWRAWLEAHGPTADEAWLLVPHRRSGLPGPTYAEAVEQALCFGWIDGLQRRHDEHHARLRFSPRRKRSRWSALNRERVERLATAGLVTDAGRAAVERARADGTWEPDGS